MLPLSSVESTKPETDSVSYVCFITQAIGRGFAAMLCTIRTLHQQCLLTSLARGYTRKLCLTPKSSQDQCVLGNRCSILVSSYTTDYYSGFISHSSCLQTSSIAPIQTHSITASLQKRCFEYLKSYDLCAIYESEMAKRKRSHSEVSKKKRLHSDVMKRKKQSHSRASKKQACSKHSKKKSPPSECSKQSHSSSSSSRSRRRVEHVKNAVKDKGLQFEKSQNFIEHLFHRIRKQSKGATESVVEEESASPTKGRKMGRSEQSNEISHHSKRTYFPPPPGITKIESSGITSLTATDKNRQKAHTPTADQCGFTQKDFSTYAPSFYQTHSRPSTSPQGRSDSPKHDLSTTSRQSVVKKKGGQQPSSSREAATFDRTKPMYPSEGKDVYI